MHRGLVQPVGQKRLTNVAVVRLKKNGHRFEIACFKNKVISWREGTEKDIDEVLQAQTVYSNVSKAVLSKTKELEDAFGTNDVQNICLEILNKGELQVAGKERDLKITNHFRDIANIIMEKTLNTQTNRPYTISMIERFMKELHFAPKTQKSSKKQALELIREMQAKFPIARARMQLKIIVPDAHRHKAIDGIEIWQGTIETQETDAYGMFSAVFYVETGYFRACSELAKECDGKVEVVTLVVRKEDDGDEDDDDRASSSSSTSAVGSSSSWNQIEASLKKSALNKNEGTKKCKTCEASFVDPKEFREHCKSPWHNHNLRRRVKSLPPLTADECLLDNTVLTSKRDDDY